MLGKSDRKRLDMLLRVREMMGSGVMSLTPEEEGHGDRMVIAPETETVKDKRDKTKEKMDKGKKSKDQTPEADDEDDFFDDE